MIHGWDSLMYVNLGSLRQQRVRGTGIDGMESGRFPFGPYSQVEVNETKSKRYVTFESW